MGWERVEKETRTQQGETRSRDSPSDPLLVSCPAVLASAPAPHLSPAAHLPGEGCEVPFPLVFVDTNFIRWGSLDPALRCISQQ